MSCETNKNGAAAAAGKSGGIPHSVSQFSHFASRVGLPAALLGGAGGLALAATAYGGVKLVKAVRRKIREAQARTEAERMARRKQFVETIKDEQSQQAAVELQQKYLGTSIRLSDLNKVFGAPFIPTPLSGNTWIAEGDKGAIAYERLGDRTAVIRAISPALGQEQALHARLGLYTFKDPEMDQKVAEASQPPAPPTSGNGKLSRGMNKATRWAHDNREELSFVAQHAGVVAAAFVDMNAAAASAGGYKNLNTSQKIKYAATFTGLMTRTAAGVQTIKNSKVDRAAHAATFRTPEYQEAAVALQRNYKGAKVSAGVLEGLLQGEARNLYEDTWVVEGDAGKIYYDRTAECPVSIQRIEAAVGQDLNLHRGLKNIVAQN